MSCTLRSWGGVWEARTEDEIGRLALLRKQVCGIEVAVHEAELRVGGRDGSGLFAAADKTGDIIVRVGLKDGIEHISSNVPGRACSTVKMSLFAPQRAQGETLYRKILKAMTVSAVSKWVSDRVENV